MGLVVDGWVEDQLADDLAGGGHPETAGGPFRQSNGHPLGRWPQRLVRLVVISNSMTLLVRRAPITRSPCHSQRIANGGGALDVTLHLSTYEPPRPYRETNHAAILLTSSVVVGSPTKK